MCLPNAKVPSATPLLNWTELNYSLKSKICLLVQSSFSDFSIRLRFDFVLLPKWPRNRLPNKVQLAKLGRSLFHLWRHERRRSGSNLHLTTASMEKVLLLPVSNACSVFPVGFWIANVQVWLTKTSKTKSLLIAVLICSIFVAVNEKQTINKNQFSNN